MFRIRLHQEREETRDHRCKFKTVAGKGESEVGKFSCQYLQFDQNRPGVPGRPSTLRTLLDWVEDTDCCKNQAHYYRQFPISAVNSFIVLTQLFAWHKMH